jgi:hypothetical protein
LFLKWRKYSRWRFSDFVCFYSSSGVYCKLIKLFFSEYDLLNIYEQIMEAVLIKKQDGELIQDGVWY